MDVTGRHLIFILCNALHLSVLTRGDYHRTYQYSAWGLMMQGACDCSGRRHLLNSYNSECLTLRRYLTPA